MCSPAFPTSLPKPRTVLQLAPNSATSTDARMRMTMCLGDVFISLVRGISTGRTLAASGFSCHGVKPYLGNPKHPNEGEAQ